jgi:hypothetical protein
MQKQSTIVATVTFWALIAASFAPHPARAIESCGSMLMPAAQLKEVSRGLSAHHSGLDLTAPYGSPVRAARGGLVVFVGSYFGYGNMVDIRLEDGTVTRYGHLSAFAHDLRVGHAVATGEQIGNIGTSGEAHGPHLHFEVRVDGKPMDPKPYLALSTCVAQPHTLTESAEAQPTGPDHDVRPGGLFQ